LSVEQRRAALASKISIENLRVDISAPIIFVCGGLTDVKEIEPPSIRDALLRRLVRDRALKVVFAEDYKDWINDSIYNDLMTFEDDIAQISSLIVLILESPGSLTELGLFSSSIDFISKLLVLVSTEHYDEDSFIKLGPIRYLESMSNSCVYAYPWDPRQPSRTIAPSVMEMFAELFDDRHKQSKPTESPPNKAD
jgi:hypothetical protein